MKENIILFDWDDTLFSKVEYKKNLRGNLARICEVSEEEIFETENKYFDSLERSDDFTIENFLESFNQKFDKKIKLEDFNSDKLGIYSTALFSETIYVLNILKETATLGACTQGFTSLQKIKIYSSGVGDCFDENFIFINRNKLDPDFIKTLPDGATIIDDKKEVVEKLNETGKFIVIWLNRNTDEKMEGIRTIRKLDELIV